MPTPNTYPSSDEEFLSQLDITPCSCAAVTPGRVASNLQRANALMAYFDSVGQVQQPSVEQAVIKQHKED